jgi:methylated-DNA-[protein]-cysteine S-methyltransferase
MINFKYKFFKGYFDVFVEDDKFIKVEIINGIIENKADKNNFFYKLFNSLLLNNIKIPLKYISIPGKTDFSRKVYLALYNTNFGQKLSYKELTKIVTDKNAFRAVGTLMKNNPLPVIIPCHRVIKSSGELGNFGNGPEWKKVLIENEIKNEVKR